MINGNLYKEMFISAANLINKNRESVNSLNVFPVPDGDTGTNMSLTMLAGKKEINDFSGNLSDCSAKLSAALLRGGRGNSGVILSLFFRGVAKSFSGKTEADIYDISNAFKAGVDAAYKAVRHPTEGTVLTVMRVMSEKASELAEEYQNADMIGAFFDKMAEVCTEVLNDTPNMLPVLKQAKVVDAGGMGFTLIMRGMALAANGTVFTDEGNEAESAKESADFADFETVNIEFPYCTECIVDKSDACNDEKVALFKSYICSVGDSVVFVDDDEIVKFHVHTKDPGTVISKALGLGALSMVKVENMRLQHSEKIAGEPQKTEFKPEKKYGFVSVAAGEGLTQMFIDLGADYVVQGGQTMNPSTEDIINAVNKSSAETVFVLPNNKNIYMAAKQAEDIVEDRKIVVIKSYTVPQGVAAMLAFDENADVTENQEIMNSAMHNVITEKITFAARDSVFDDKEIKEGQLLGMVEGSVKYVCDDISECVSSLADDIVGKDCITLYYGNDKTEEDAKKMAEVIKEKVPDADITIVNGGQPVYFYMIAAESL